MVIIFYDQKLRLLLLLLVIWRWSYSTKYTVHWIHRLETFVKIGYNAIVASDFRRKLDIRHQLDKQISEEAKNGTLFLTFIWILLESYLV